MKRSLVAMLSVLLAVSAEATALRTFVASTGLDTNPCSRLSPCRSFAAALVQTTAKGEIIVLDSAGYGPVTIGQSVTITTPLGVYAGITNSGGDGITISGTSDTDIVVLHGLTINGGGTGNSGVNATSGGSINIGELHIENCVITSFATSGVSFSPVDTSVLRVRDTVVRDTNFGLVVGTGNNGIANVSVERSEASKNPAGGFGFFGPGTTAVLYDCVVDGNSTAFLVGGASVDVNGCTISHNNLAISNDGTATIRVANTVIAHNVTGLSGTGTLTRISGDPANPVKTNTLSGNTIDGAFSGTFRAQ
jgi:hypothetical protein